MSAAADDTCTCREPGDDPSCYTVWCQLARNEDKLERARALAVRWQATGHEAHAYDLRRALGSAT